MGATHVTVAIRNLAEPDRVWEGLFLVDTGATDCLVPRQHLESIGLIPEGQRVYELADGSELRMDITVAQSRVHGGVRRRHHHVWRGGRRATARGDSSGIGGDRGRPAQPGAQKAPSGTAQGISDSLRTGGKRQGNRILIWLSPSPTAELNRRICRFNSDCTNRHTA